MMGVMSQTKNIQGMEDTSSQSLGIDCIVERV